MASKERLETDCESAERAFKKHGGVLRTSQALALGVRSSTLYAMRDSDHVVQLSRGLFRLADLPEVTHPDLVTVALKIPGATVCLISALAFHGITTEIPHEVYIALARGREQPRLEHPPVRVFRFSVETLAAGAEEHKLDGVKVRVYGAEKTLADCFKFRNKIGLDVAIEALKMYLACKDARPAKLLDFARLCRVERVMRPYLEALV